MTEVVRVTAFDGFKLENLEAVEVECYDKWTVYKNLDNKNIHISHIN